MVGHITQVQGELGILAEVCLVRQACQRGIRAGKHRVGRHGSVQIVGAADGSAIARLGAAVHQLAVLAGERKITDNFSFSAAADFKYACAWVSNCSVP